MSPIKTALCSFGMSGKVFHAPFLHVHPGFELTGVFERSKQLAAASYPSIISYPSLDAMLADGQVELVIVNTPNASHFDYAKQALMAGKHVLVEKPFVISSQQGKELGELAQKQGRQLAVFHNRRFDSDFLTVKKVLDEKLLGEVVEAEFHFDRFKQQLSPKLHKELPGDGAGIVYDLGSHIIDQALYLFGMPEAVYADIAVMRPISQVDDYFEILLFYPNKRVRLKGGYVVKEPVPSFIIHGTQGSFLKPRADIQEASLLTGGFQDDPNWGKEPETGMGLLHTEVEGKLIQEYLPSERGNYRLFFDGLYSAIRNEDPVPVSAMEGTRVIRVIEAAFESSKTCRKILL